MSDARAGEVTAFLALGGNLGDRAAHLRAAVAGLGARPHTRVQAVSSIYETPPLGPADQPSYFNAVVQVATTLGPHELLAAGLALEQAAGRVRRERWGARTLDVDVLIYGDWQHHDERLTLPHPEMLGRAFVLVPLAELAPDLVLEGRTAAARVATIDTQGIRKVGTLK
jgi:2-amino-4-hydroxy-6-hydroxymethyldihydropteridine diphosphokinase